MKNKKEYFVYSRPEKYSSQEVYWNNQDGWVKYRSANFFTYDEKINFNLPIPAERGWKVGWGKK